MKKLFLSLLAYFAISGFLFAQVNSGHMANPPAQMKVKTVLNAKSTTSANYLVLADDLPWASNAVVDILTANGETFSVANSATFPGLDFSIFDVIVVLSDQNPVFHAAFVANFSKFVDFVTAGGSLEVHAATCGWNSPCGYSVLLPGGVNTVEQYDSYNDVTLPLHPIVAGVPGHFSGTHASHGIFQNLLPGTDIITVASSNALPTTIQYKYGTGVVTATTVTYEFACSSGQDACIMLHNNLNYSDSHATAAVVPTLSEWGLILLGFVMLVFGSIYILRLKA